MSIAGPAELCAMTTAPAAMNSTTLMPKCSSRMVCKPARWLCRIGCVYIVIYRGCYIYVYITTVCVSYNSVKLGSQWGCNVDILMIQWGYIGEVCWEYSGYIFCRGYKRATTWKEQQKTNGGFKLWHRKPSRMPNSGISFVYEFLHYFYKIWRYEFNLIPHQES